MNRVAIYARQSEEVYVSATTTATGPAFQFRDVNTTFDLHLAGENIPGTIGKGDNLRVTARAGDHEDKFCLFLLEPVKTEFR